MSAQQNYDDTPQFQLTDFLPTTKKECELRGWDQLDVILFSGDAYIDHPSFGVAVIGRTLEAAGYRVAIVTQPDWHGDYRDFKKLGRPRLFFGISPGAMDSMVNKYTANRRLRSRDEYSPDGRHDKRPEYPTIVYTRILKEIYPDVPVVLGGIEASMRRLTHYDYWKDRLMKCILCDSGADLLIYGMGEKSIVAIARELEEGCQIRDVRDVPQTVFLSRREDIPGGIREDDIVLHTHEECLRNKKFQAENFRHIEEESNKRHASRILQGVDGRFAVVNPPYPPMTTEELDASFDLPYTRYPHPKYKGKTIPAFEMIKFSVNIHRGCFGGCAFCTISAHQGKFISCRSKENILREVRKVIQMPGFKGYLSDLGGPSANMYGMHGRNLKACEHCKRPSCIHPQICPNLNTSHQKLLDIYHAVDALPGIKKSFIGSGVRYDLLLHRGKDEEANRSTEEYTRELITRHVSGRLKVAPEHMPPRPLPDAQALLRSLLPLQGHLRPHQPRGGTQPADHPLFHLLPPRLPRRGHGRACCHHQGPGLPPGAGAGLHAHADDGLHRGLVHGLRPLHPGARLLCQDALREARPAHVLLLVPARPATRHRARTAPPGTDRYSGSPLRRRTEAGIAARGSGTARRPQSPRRAGS